jgi:AAA+ ATPase superfamily predicted ATPase
MFFGRGQELSRLHEEFAAKRPSLLVVYGRRRVGKSELLKEATTGRPHIIFQATRVTSDLNLQTFKAEIAHSLGSDALLDSLNDWMGVLTYLARKAEDIPGLVVVLDEFPYLVDTNPALPSIVQKFWDLVVAGNGSLNLVLCGSLIAQMEELLAERNPLHGRRTLSMDVQPLPLRDAAQFFPHYPAEDRIQAYAVFGGVPAYLRLCDASRNLRRNIIDLMLTNAAVMMDEPELLLQSELRETQRYASVLAAIAGGCTKRGEIIDRVGDLSNAASLSPYLERLERMRFVRQARSMDAAPKARDHRYFIDDPFIAFWHRFVRPNMSSITQGFGADVWRYQVQPRLDDYMGPAFEEICRNHVRRHAQERLPAPAQVVGQIWAADYDIDIAGRLLDDSMLYGECKWRRGAVCDDVLTALMERADRTAFGRGVQDRHYVLYARTGFSSAVTKRAARDERIVLYTPEDMLGATSPRSA